jgi:hypothetical protein
MPISIMYTVPISKISNNTMPNDYAHANIIPKSKIVYTIEMSNFIMTIMYLALNRDKKNLSEVTVQVGQRPVFNFASSVFCCQLLGQSLPHFLRI